MELEKYECNNSQTKLSTKGHDFTSGCVAIMIIIETSCQTYITTIALERPSQPPTGYNGDCGCLLGVMYFTPWSGWFVSSVYALLQRCRTIAICYTDGQQLHSLLC